MENLHSSSIDVHCTSWTNLPSRKLMTKIDGPHHELSVTRYTLCCTNLLKLMYMCVLVGIWWLSERGDSFYNSSILRYRSCQWVWSNYSESPWVHKTFTGFLFYSKYSKYIKKITISDSNLKLLDMRVCIKVLRNHPGDQSYWHRHTSKGSWTLSSADNGWAVSDTTGEALKVDK